MAGSADDGTQPSSPVCYAREVDPTYMGLSGNRLRQFGPSIWYAEGPVVRFLGFPYPTRMAVIQKGCGDLFLWSPITLTDDLRREIDALGPVADIVSPNSIHHLFLREWTNAYPGARLYAPPGLRRKRKDLSFVADLGDHAEPAWEPDMDQVLMRGSLFMTEVVFFHRSSATAIFGDLFQNFPRTWFRGWRGVLARLDGIVAPNPGAPREWRASFLGRRVARAALTRILAWPIEKVLMAHGDPVTQDGQNAVARSFAWLR